MGLFLSFLGGASERFTEVMQETEKTAKAEAALSTKALYEGYSEVVKQNRKLESELKADVSFLKSLNPNATEDQISAMVFNRPVMEMLKKKIEAGDVNPAQIDFDTLTGISKQNTSQFAAAERVDSFLKLPKATQQVQQTVEGLGFFDRVAVDKRRAAEKQAGAAYGVSVEDMKAAMKYERVLPDVGARFDLSVLAKPEKMEDRVNKAQVAYDDALQSGNPTAIESAKVRLDMIKENKDLMSSETEKFNNNLARLKRDSIGNDPIAKAAADKELARIWALEKREREAKKTSGEKAAESRVPSLGTLNSFTGAAVADAITSKYGKQVKDGTIAIVREGDGVRIVPLMTDAATRQKIAEDQVRAATQALSLYIDKNGVPINNDVASAINRYKVAAQFSTEEGPPPTTPAQRRPAPPKIPMKPAAAPATPTPSAIPKYNPQTGEWE